jgi:hypothetical protein
VSKPRSRAVGRPLNAPGGARTRVVFTTDEVAPLLLVAGESVVIVDGSNTVSGEARTDADGSVFVHAHADLQSPTVIVRRVTSEKP